MSDEIESKDKQLFCSFCGKNQSEVKKLIAGPSVYICDECVSLCNDIIKEDLSEKDNYAPHRVCGVCAASRAPE